MSDGALVEQGVVIPDGRDLIPKDLASRVCGALVKAQSVDVVYELRRQVAALRQWATKREHRTELQAAERWCEVRIGELLGPGKPGPPESSPASEVGKEKHDAFRPVQGLAALPTALGLLGMAPVLA